MSKRVIWLNGCDDSTRIEFEATDSEMQFLTALAEESHRRGGGCNPTLSVEIDGKSYPSWDWEDSKDE